VLAEPEWEALARENGAGQVVVAGHSNLALGLAAAEAFLGRPVDGHVDVQLPGRLERLSEDPQPPTVFKPDLDPHLEEIVLHAIDRVPRNRYSSADKAILKPAPMSPSR